MNKFLNRPLSPHLTIYLPQSSSLSSIWHRLSALIMIFSMWLFSLFQKTFVWNLSSVLLFKHTQNFDATLILSFIIFTLLFSLSYHSVNGLRHISWDLVLFLDKTSSILIISLSALLLIIIINFYIY